MLAKKYRLPINDFVGKKGKFLKNPFFSLRIFDTSANFSRFGITISAKSAPKASSRNRIKRSFFNYLRETAKSLPLADYWITVSAQGAGLPKEEFIRELGRIIK